MRLTTSEDEELRELAVLCLCNLACGAPTEKTLTTLVAAGALPPLLALTTSTNEHCRRLALISLRRLSRAPANRLHLLRAGALSALVASLQVAHAETLEVTRPSEAASEPARRPARRPGPASALAFSRSRPAPAAGAAVGSGQATPTAGSGGGAFGEQLEVQREVAVAVCNMSLELQCREAMATHAVLEHMVGLSESPDLEVARHASGCLANLTEELRCHEHLTEKVVPVVGEAAGAAGAAGGEAAEGAIVATPTEEATAVAARAEQPVVGAEAAAGVAQGSAESSAESSAEGGADAGGGTTAGDSGANVGRSCESTLLRLLRHPAVDVTREAIRGVSNLLSSFHHHGRTLRFGLDAVVALLLSRDPETRYAATVCVRKLSPNLESHVPLVDAGVLPCLMTLLDPKHRPPLHTGGDHTSSGAADAPSDEEKAEVLEAPEKEEEEDGEGDVLDPRLTAVVRTQVGTNPRTCARVHSPALTT